MKENFVTIIPLTIYRRLRWEKRQRKAYKQCAANYGKEYAQICYNAEKALRCNKSEKEICFWIQKKDDIIFKHLSERCPKTLSALETYRQLEDDHGTLPPEKKIWVFWWSGEASAPPIIKACIQSIRRNANGHEVVVLDSENYLQYADFPAAILKKHEQGVIGHAHFSDMLRMSLLEKYGGVWIDATVFISQQLPAELFTTDFYTAKSGNHNAHYISKSRWVGYFWAGNRSFPLWRFVKDMLVEYWENSDGIIDYLLMDYVIDIAYRNIPQIRNLLDGLQDNNLKRGTLMRRINEAYSEELFSELQQGETFLSKLSWRYGNPQPVTKSGEKTNYGHLLEIQ